MSTEYVTPVLTFLLFECHLIYPLNKTFINFVLLRAAEKSSVPLPTLLVFYRLSPIQNFPILDTGSPWLFVNFYLESYLSSFNQFIHSTTFTLVTWFTHIWHAKCVTRWYYRKWERFHQPRHCCTTRYAAPWLWNELPTDLHEPGQIQSPSLSPITHGSSSSLLSPLASSLTHSYSFWTQDLALQQILSSIDLFFSYRTASTDHLMILLCSAAGFICMVC